MHMGDGFIIVREGMLRNFVSSKQYTLAVVGSSRGGTSSLAYAFARTGVPFGSDSSINHEDKEILAGFPKKKVLHNIFQNRNKQNEIWGFKIPEAAFLLPWLDMELRKPIFFYVFRNPLSVARSILNRDPIYGDGNIGLLNSLLHPLRYYNHFGETFRRLESPIVLVEYENLKANSFIFCKTLFDILGFSSSIELINDIASNISAPGYKKISGSSA